MLRNPVVSKKKSTTECRISKNRPSKNACDSMQNRSNNASGYKTKNGRAKFSRSEVNLKNGNCNEASTNTLACGKENSSVLNNDPNKPNAQEIMEVNLLNKQTPRNIENIFYKEISNCMNQMKNTSLLIDVVQASVPHEGRCYSKDRKCLTTPRRKMAYNRKNSTPNGAFTSYGFDCNNKVKKRRPQTAPLSEKNNAKLEILTKSTSATKLLVGKDFLSKIPVLARYLKARCGKGTMNKAKTSPELKFRGNDGQKTNSIKIQQKYVDIWANRAEYCKRVHGKTKINKLSEEKPIKFSKESGFNSNLSAIKSIGIERSSSLQSTMKKSVTSKIPRTISSLTFSSASKIGNDTDVIKKTCKSQQGIVSRIPIGVRSNIGIAKKESISDDKCCSSQTNDAQNNTLKDHITPLTKVTIEGFKVTNPPVECGTNLSKKQFNPNQIAKISREDKSRVLEAKRGVENICKRKIHFCSGDRNDDVVFYKRFPGKVMNKVIKPKKASNFKHRNVLVNNKVDVIPVISSPDTRIAKPIAKEVSHKAVHSVKLMKNEELGHLEEVSNKIDNLTISRNINPFSDTNLLKLNKNCSLKSFCPRKRCHAFPRSEKCVQTIICNKDIGVQVDYFTRDPQHISSEVKDANGSLKCESLKLNDWKFPISHREVGTNTYLNAVLDYCADLLKTRNDLEEVLMQCSVFENARSMAIGCQSDELSLIDSFSQTSCCASDKSCQCCQAQHTIRFTLTSLPVPANMDRTNNSLKDTSRNKTDFITSLDGPDCKGKMACYCKEVPLDKKADIEQERPRNLYEDDEEGDEYSEPYMTELVNTVHIEDDTKLCGSVPSLPEVAIPNDKCESKIEIPWLKISLAPPGYYQIKNKEGHPNKVVCDCWALSTGDDVYTESLEKKPEKFAEASGPNVCVCKKTKAAEKDVAEKKERTFAVIKTDAKAKKPIRKGKKDGEARKEKTDVAEPGSDTTTESENEKEIKPEIAETATEKPVESEITEEKPVESEITEEKPVESEITDEKPVESEITEEKPVESEITEEKPVESEITEEKPVEPEIEEEKPEIAEEKPAESEIVEEKPEAVEEKPAEPEINEEKPEEFETDQGKPENVEAGAEKPDISEGNPEEPETGGEKVTEGNIEGDDKGKPDETGGPPAELSSSSGSIPSTCTCLHHEEECVDIMGKPTAFVYDNPCFGQHEMYMDPIYKLFPEDCDTYCGPHIEMPWSDLTIPRNIKLRVTKKPKSNIGECKCDRGEKGDEGKRDEEEVIVCGNKDNDPSAGDKTATKSGDDAVNMEDKEIEIQLSITQSPSNTHKTDSKCTDIRPSSKEKGTNSNFCCKCAGSPIRTAPSKSRSPQCKCPESRSSVKINLDSSRNRSGNRTCDPCNTRSRRRSTEKGLKRPNSSVMDVLETCEAEMVPLRDTLNQLKSKIRNLNIPELNNWNGQPGHNSPCPPCPPPMRMPMAPSQPVVNRPPCCVSSPSQKYQSRPQTSPQCPFSSMFSGMPRGMSAGIPSGMSVGMPPGMSAGMPPGMSAGMPPGMPSGIPASRMPPSMLSMPPRPMTSTRGCCPHCSCKEMRSRRRSGSSSADYSDYEYDSVSDGESKCPFLRALSSKNIYKEKDPKGHRRSRTKHSLKISDGSKRKSPSSAKRFNKRSQAESCRNDNCTDTEPEIQIHYEPKRPRMKTKQVFKTVVDPNMVSPKSQRLRIAVRVTPSGEEMNNDKLLAIQGPGNAKGWGCRQSR